MLNAPQEIRGNMFLDFEQNVEGSGIWPISMAVLLWETERFSIWTYGVHRSGPLLVLAKRHRNLNSASADQDLASRSPLRL